MRLLIMGPPGAGKGTQASRIAEQYAIPAISTGDIFRTNIKDETELGVRVKAILDAGGYVPDEVTNEIVRDRLTWGDAAQGWLLDGFPRTAGQVDFLDGVLAESGAAVDAVVSLTVDEESVVGRLIKRAQTDGRTDDTEEVIRERQAIYRKETAPLLEHYGERGIVVEVDGMGEVDEVTTRLVTAIDGLRAPREDLRVRIGRRQTPAKSVAEIVLMRRAGLLVGETLAMLRREARAGLTTLELDTLAEDHIRTRGGVPNFQLVPGYRHTLCTSVNDEVVHGIPGSRVLHDGDLLSIDCGAQVDGWNGDAAMSLVVGGAEAAAASDTRLVETTEASMWAGIGALAVGQRLFAVGEAVEASIEASAAQDGHDYGIVEEYVGHGIGRTMHEDPQIPNYGVRDHGPIVRDGFTGAIEPMVTWGSPQTRVLDDDWTVVTVDGSRAAHWENSVAVTSAGLWVLTALDGGEAALGRLGAPYAPLGD